LQGNIYDAIRKRSDTGERFSSRKENDNPPSSLENFKEKLDIPDDVLKSLSPSEIQGILKKTRKDVTGNK